MKKLEAVKSCNEIRCTKCSKKLLEAAEYKKIMIKCPRCKSMNTFNQK